MTVPPFVVPSEGPNHHLRNALQILALARYGQTEIGKPGRVLTDEEFRGVIDRVMQAVRQLEAPKVGVE